MTDQTFAASLLVSAALAAAAAAPAQAQSRNCGPHGAVTAHLAERFSESRQMIGLGANNQIVEVYASPESGSWTILVSRPDGLACIVAAGENFEMTQDPLPNTDPEA